MGSPLSVGDRAFLPNRLPPDHPGYASAAEIFGSPGTIVSVDDGWAMVDRGSWGRFGCPVADLRAASFTCPECGRTSPNPNDIREGYCGACHWWTGDPVMLAAWREERQSATAERGAP